MKITEELDSGPIMKKIKININPEDTSGEISDKLSDISKDNILKILDDIFSKKAKFTEQDHNFATYAKKIKKGEGKINWEKNAKNIIGKINGLNPNPGAWFEYKKIRYKIWKASISEKQGKIGEILDSNFLIGCVDKSIKIIEIQREGKNRLLLEDFLLGVKFEIGDLVK